MQQILAYGDSLTWGIVPDTRERFAFEDRWPGALEIELHSQGRKVRVLEDALNGRRTVWEDPFKAGRNGLAGLAQRMEVHSPLSLVVVMLGTNDFQFSHPHNNAWSAALGITTLVNEMRRAPIEPGMPVPPILLVAPPPLGVPRGALAPKFAGAEARCRGLAEAYRTAALALECHFFDAGSVVASSAVDGIHLDREQQIALGKALAEPVLAALGR